MMKVRCWRSTDTTSTPSLAPATWEFFVPVSHEAPSHSRPVPEPLLVPRPHCPTMRSSSLCSHQRIYVYSARLRNVGVCVCVEEPLSERISRPCCI